MDYFKYIERDFQEKCNSVKYLLKFNFNRSRKNEK